MIVDNAFQILPLDEQPTHPSELAARVAEIERDRPELADVIRHVIDVATKTGARDDQAPER